jgi:hypothetical protein
MLCKYYYMHFSSLPGITDATFSELRSEEQGQQDRYRGLTVNPETFLIQLNSLHFEASVILA